MKKQRVAIGVLLAMVLTLFAFPLTASAQNTWHVSKWTKYEAIPSSTQAHQGNGMIPSYTSQMFSMMAPIKCGIPAGMA